MKQFALDLMKKLALAGIILGFVYGILQVVVYIGFFKVLAGLYLLMGFMIAWETRQGQKHRLWFLVIIFWLPMIAYGLARRGFDFTQEISEVAEREIQEREE